MSKEKFVLFNVNNDEGQDESILQLDSTIPKVQISPSIKRDHSVDIDRMAGEILDKAEREKREPILNIQVRSSEMPPLIDEDKLSALKALRIKVVFSFEHYDSRNSGSKWRSILKDADHVFFANDRDRADAVSQGHVVGLKASYVLPSANLIESEILSRKPNIFMSEGLENNKTISEVVEAAKVSPGTKIIMAVDTASQKSVTNAIAARFGISDSDQLLGITLEVEDILRDKVHGPKKLEAYVSQLTKQFRDEGKEVNPVEIYCDFSNPQTLQNLHKQAKYTILSKDPQARNLSNGCIPLAQQGGGTKEEIISELSAREQEAVLNQTSISEMQEVRGQAQAKTAQALHKLDQSVRSQSDSIKQPDYLYQDTDIEILLKLYLDPEKVSIQPVLSLRPSYREVLSGTMLGAIMSIESGEKEAAVIPLETGGAHWVCLTVTKDKDGQMVFTYNDPNGTPIGVRGDLVEMIGAMAPQAKIVDLQTKQQQNDTDCGPFVVDNLVKMATGKPILDTQKSQNAGEELRAQHALAISAKQATEQATSIKQSITHSSTVVPRSVSSIRPSSVLGR